MKDILKERDDLVEAQRELLGQCLTAFELLEMPMTPQTILFIEMLRTELYRHCKK